jgi:hypothetical protein
VSAIQAVIASALLVGSGVASTALWYYSRRYVGELALLRDTAGRPTAARFSVLDFWGNREVLRDWSDCRAPVVPCRSLLLLEDPTGVGVWELFGAGGYFSKHVLKGQYGSMPL